MIPQVIVTKRPLRKKIKLAQNKSIADLLCPSHHKTHSNPAKGDTHICLSYYKTENPNITWSQNREIRNEKNRNTIENMW